MTDGRLRAASRAVAQGEPFARARLLLESVRAGQLTEGQLRVAAWLGDADAVAVGGGLVKGQPDQLLPWLLELAGFGTREPVVRALASVGLARADNARRGPEMEVAVGVIRRWLEQPFVDHSLCDAAARLAARAARRSPRGASALLLCAWAIHLASSPAGRWNRLARQRLTRWASLSNDADPRPVIRQALLPWALGERFSPASTTT